MSEAFKKGNRLARMSDFLLNWAVHMPDNLVTLPWWAGGWALAALLIVWSAWGLEDQDIPRVALLSAVFFITTLVHIPIPGGPKAHLLLNGLTGVILGRRAILAIAPGLFLQAVLFGHGGFLSLGLNLCVIGIPALIAGGIFRSMAKWYLGTGEGFGRFALLAGLNWAILCALVLCVFLFQAQWSSNSEEEVFRDSWARFQDLWIGAWVMPPAVLLTLFLRGSDQGGLFSLGVVTGEAAVLLTLLGNSLVLYFGGILNWAPLILITCVIHLPLAVLEGLAAGFLVGFLSRTRPDLLGLGNSMVGAQPSPPAHQQKISCFLLALLGTVLATSAWAGAHKLVIEHKILSKGQIEIECYFDISGDVPKKARVEVYRGEEPGPLLGELNEKGKFQFQVFDSTEIRVRVITLDHAGEIRIQPQEQEQFLAVEPAGPKKESPSKRDLPFPVKDLLLGLAIISSLAALIMVWRLKAKLKKLER